MKVPKYAGVSVADSTSVLAQSTMEIQQARELSSLSVSLASTHPLSITHTSTVSLSTPSSVTLPVAKTAVPSRVVAIPPVPLLIGVVFGVGLMLLAWVIAIVLKRLFGRQKRLDRHASFSTQITCCQSIDHFPPHLDLHCKAAASQYDDSNHSLSTVSLSTQHLRSFVHHSLFSPRLGDYTSLVTPGGSIAIPPTCHLFARLLHSCSPLKPLRTSPIVPSWSSQSKVGHIEEGNCLLDEESFTNSESEKPFLSLSPSLAVLLELQRLMGDTSDTTAHFQISYASSDSLLSCGEQIPHSAISEPEGVCLGCPIPTLEELTISDDVIAAPCTSNPPVIFEVSEAVPPVGEVVFSGVLGSMSTGSGLAYARSLSGWCLDDPYEHTSFQCQVPQP